MDSEMDYFSKNLWVTLILGVFNNYGTTMGQFCWGVNIVIIDSITEINYRCNSMQAFLR